MQKKVFIIIVSYNGEKWIDKNLKSIANSNYPVSTIIVDNNSRDNSVKLVKQFKDVHVIKSEINLGFGKANNLGIKFALKQKADYVFLLNQDTWMFPDTIENLVLEAEKNKSIGVFSPIHFSSDVTVLDENFKTYWGRRIKSISNTLDEVTFVNAAAWLISSEVIKKVGYFEPLFNHYGEDRNYVDRVKFHNYKVGIVKNAKICHDRIVHRNFKKDLIQSKFMLLRESLNINNNLVVSYFKAFYSVFGLSKFFFKSYSIFKISTFFLNLLAYYMGLKFKVFKIYKTRLEYK